MEISVRSANVEKIFMGVSLLPVTDFYNELDLVSSFDYKKLIIVYIRCCCVYTCTKMKQYFITDGHIVTIRREHYYSSPTQSSFYQKNPILI